MPITPLHIGVLAPINHFSPGKVSATSFAIGQVLLDAESIRYYLTGYGDVSHGSHTLFAALMLGAWISIVGFWSARWVWGAFIGTFSHVLLDALVHTDVELLGPWVPGNALNAGLMEPLSFILLVMCAWWGLQKMSKFRCWLAGILAPAGAAPLQTAASGLSKIRPSRWFALPPWRRMRWDLGRAGCLLAILVLPMLLPGSPTLSP